MFGEKENQTFKPESRVCVTGLGQNSKAFKSLTLSLRTRELKIKKKAENYSVVIVHHILSTPFIYTKNFFGKFYTKNIWNNDFLRQQSFSKT